jgi:MSHA biogenesis protein MshQ
LKNYTDNLNSGETNVINVSPISEGVGDITLSAPGNNNYGSVDVDFTSNQFLHENDSAGKATFGLYRGRDRIIMWEEVPANQ